MLNLNTSDLRKRKNYIKVQITSNGSACAIQPRVSQTQTSVLNKNVTVNKQEFDT